MEDVRGDHTYQLEGLTATEQALAGYEKAHQELLSHVKVLVERDWDLLGDPNASDRGALRSLYHFRDAAGKALCRLDVPTFDLVLLSELEVEVCCLRCKEISTAMSEGWGGKENKWNKS